MGIPVADYKRPNTRILKVRVTHTKSGQQGLEHFATRINTARPQTIGQWAGDRCLLLVFMRRGMLLSSTKSLMRYRQAATGAVRVELEDKTDHCNVRFVFQTNHRDYDTWENSNVVRFGDGCEERLLSAMINVYDGLESGRSVHGVEFDSWSWVFDRLFPGE